MSAIAQLNSARGPVSPGVNLNQVERIVSALAGGALLAVVARKPTLVRLPIALGAGMLLYRGMRGQCPAYKVLGLSSVSSAGRLALPHAVEPLAPVQLRASITIRRSAEELVALLKDPLTLKSVLGEVADANLAGANEIEWCLKVPITPEVRFRTRWSESALPTRLTWETPSQQGLRVSGALDFGRAPAERGTVVQLQLELELPGGRAARALTKLLRALPEKATETALRRFKSLAETGEIPTLARNPAARQDGRDQ